MNKSVTVVGAGIAGLTAAYRLRLQGFSVKVIESSERVGGRMSTERVDGNVADRGAQFLASAYHTLIPLVRELGLESELVATKPYSAIVKNGKIKRLRHEKTSSRIGYVLKTSGGLFGAAKTAVNGLPLLKLANDRKDDYSLWERFDNEDSAEWFERSFGKESLEYVLEPQLEGFFFHGPENNSKALAQLLLAFNTAKGKVMTMERGLGSITEALARDLDIHLNEKVIKVARNMDGTATVTTSKLKYDSDYVVMAAPAPIAQSLMKPVTATENSLLSTQYASTIVITLAASKNWSKSNKSLNDVYGFLIPRKERNLVCAVGIETNKCSLHTEAPELLNIMTEGAQTPELLGLSDDEILARVLPDLETYFPGISDCITYKMIVRWKNAQTLSPVGRAKDIHNYRQQLNKTLPIVLAGDYMGYGATDSASQTGEWAANSIMEAAITAAENDKIKHCG